MPLFRNRALLVVLLCLLCLPLAGWRASQSLAQALRGEWACDVKATLADMGPVAAKEKKSFGRNIADMTLSLDIEAGRAVITQRAPNGRERTVTLRVGKPEGNMVPVFDGAGFESVLELTDDDVLYFTNAKNEKERVVFRRKK